MARPENVMQVFSRLDKSNCRKCGEKTCLAFASLVFQGRRDIAECPTVDRGAIAEFSREGSHTEPGAESEEWFDLLKSRVAELDLARAAKRIGGRFDGRKLTVKILGKDFSIDPGGECYSDIHINPWITAPFLTYVLECRGEPLTGDWVSYRELKDAKERYPLFQRRCEEAMKHIADVYTDLFDDMVHLFQGRQVPGRFESDISVILPVLPLVPLMICYWKPEDGMESSLNVFFDRSAEVNIGSGAAFNLGAGLTRMFEKLAVRHGFAIEQ